MDRPSRPRPTPRRARDLTHPFIVAASALLLAACGGGGVTPVDPGNGGGDGIPAISVPVRGTATTFDVATWNVEWFGDPGNGPDDDELQLARVRDVINGAEIDVWGLQEIVDEDDFAALLLELPGYDGLLANDPSVVNGPYYYNGFGGNEQKVALVWRTAALEVTSARVALGANDYEFAGRPPLEVRARVTVDGASEEIVILVLHAKASTDQQSWERRRAASAAMKSYLDRDWPNEEVFVIGDFNDDVDTSIRSGNATPYANFVADTDDWRFVSAELSAAGATSTVRYSDMIDHLLVSDEALAGYQAGSVQVFRLDSVITGYGNLVSDHYPVLARFRTGR